MDLATIIGLVVAVALVLGAILVGESPVMFLNVPSILIVVGGTLGATLVRNPLATVLGTFKVVTKAFMTKVPSPNVMIEQIVVMSKKARKESLLSLEKVEISDPFLDKGIHLCVDGLEPAQIRAILETEILSTAARHKRGKEVLEGIGAAAPAFGMLGTLIGLVQMLMALDDPDAIGPAMAVALLTTMYGAFIANVFALPLADKLKVRSGEEVLNMNVCMEGVIGIVQGEHPASIDEKLKAFIPPGKRDAGKKAEPAKQAEAAA
jgi:chemotaxis protein MotA